MFDLLSLLDYWAGIRVLDGSLWVVGWDTGV